MDNQTAPQDESKPPVQLPPELQLLYDSLSDKIDKIDQKIPNDFNLPKHAREVEEIKVQHDQLKSRLSRVECENESLKQKLTLMEDKMLEHNIVLIGIPEDKWEDQEPRKDKVCNELAHLMDGLTQEKKIKNANDLDIMYTEHLGRFNPQKGRPISVRFVHKHDVDMILANKKKLSKGVFVDQRYSDETKLEWWRLRPVLRAARRLEEYRGMCNMEGTVIVIKGKRYSWSNLHKLPQNLSTHSVSSRQSSTHYGFFGELNSLSNFHPAPFIYNGQTYTSSEQVIQATKATFCGDQETWNQIMESKSPLECKNLGKEITNCNNTNWNKAAKDLCYPGILVKFQQNPGLAAFLKNTGDKTIVECCYDKTWWNGIPLSNPLCTDPKTYKKQSILGELLEEVRAALLSGKTSSSNPVNEIEPEDSGPLPV